MTFLLVAVRKVVAGHKMVVQGHATVVEGWELFEEAVEEAGPGDLPNLLCQLKGKTTPMQMPTPPPQVHRWKLGSRPLCRPLLHPLKKNFVTRTLLLLWWGGLESGHALSATQYGDHKMGVMPI